MLDTMIIAIVVFRADKTKVTVTGSKHDIQDQKVNIWSLYGSPITVAENNGHLGFIVSSIDEMRRLKMWTKYQPSGKGGTRSPPAMPAKSKMAARFLGILSNFR